LVSSILVVAIVVMLVLHQTRAAHKYHPQQQQRLSQTLKFENNDNRRSTTLKR
jgi:type II secretory pathway component PulJ